MYDRNRVTRVTGVNRMTRVRYLSSYLEWVSHQDFKNIAYVGFFRHFVCVFVIVFVFVIAFVFVFVSSYDFWIAIIISFQNMYGYRGLWSLELMTEGHTHSNSTYRLGPSGKMGRVKMTTNDYQWLPMTANDYQWLPITTNDYQWLSMTTDDYRWLPITTDEYWWIPMTTDDYQWQPMTKNEYQWLPMTTNDYQWLSITINDYQINTKVIAVKKFERLNRISATPWPWQAF